MESLPHGVFLFPPPQLATPAASPPGPRPLHHSGANFFAGLEAAEFSGICRRLRSSYLPGTGFMSKNSFV